MSIKISVIASLYRADKYLSDFFKNFISIDGLDQIELVIVHNDPTQAENKIIDSWRKKIPNFQYLKVPREGLYKSWNRGIKHASGKYVGMWNVDDRRKPESLLEQAKVLDTKSEYMMVTGDYQKVFSYRDEEGIYKRDPVKRGWINNLPRFHNGCFLLWRKEVHEKIGYFDEQFRIAGDTEFWYRLNYNYKTYPLNKVVGYYLRKSNEGLSKKGNPRYYIEQYIFRRRFFKIFIVNGLNVFKKIKEERIDIHHIVNFDEKVKIKNMEKNTNIITTILSVIFFWYQPLVKKLVELKFFALEKINQ